MRENERLKTVESVRKGQPDGKGDSKSTAAKDSPESKSNWEIKDPLTWTASNIDEVAEMVKDCPSAGHSSAFWNTYAGSFGTIPCNLPLRNMILRAKRFHPAYSMIPEEEYVGDVTALMWAGRLSDWNPKGESLEHYIGCRCRPNAEYGRSIIRAHGNRIYAWVKDNGDGSLYICSTGIRGMKDSQGYVKKYVNLPVMSVDAMVCEDSDRTCSFLERYAVPDNCPGRMEEESTRLWLMKTCHVTEYEMAVCEAIAGYGKCLDSWIVEEINRKIVVPSGRPSMSQKELYQFNFRVHKRARHHYGKAMAGIR